ncbi:MAG: D-glycerate dehydrogenase [Acidobacteria bacterium]|nr:D-glycerate dehydrogenase [Acidobacteriota bacterium]
MGPLRVFATCDIGEEALGRLRELHYQVEIYPGAEPPPHALILEKVSSGIDALITTIRDRIDEEIFKAGAGTLRVVAQDAVGLDNISIESANRYRIPLVYTPDVLTDTTAEFALFILGCVARKLYPSEKLVREHQWKLWHPSRPFLGEDVSDKTVSVIGTGRIGKAFALRCSTLNVDLLCHTRSPDHVWLSKIQNLLELQHSSGLIPRGRRIAYVSLEECLRRGDFISLHVPLTAQTHHLINRATLKLFKRQAFLINTSRGAIVDEQALCEALKKEEIAGAALDVFEREPLPEDSPLRDPALESRLRLFHHFGSGTQKTRLSSDPDVGMAGRCVQGVIDVLEGRYGGNPAHMPYVANKEAFLPADGN